MKYAIQICTICAAILTATLCHADLPIVEEAYDEVCIMSISNQEFVKILFVRDGRLMATRIYSEDMVFGVRGDKFLLEWDDYHSCRRIIEFQSLAIMSMPEDPTVANGPWWDMARRMVDLKEPPPRK
jgi:hypothetical protein